MIWQAAFFDMDGTLADTLADIAYAINRSFAERGYPTHPLHAFRSFVGDGLVLTIQRAMPPGAGPVTTEMTESIKKYYWDEVGNRSALYDGIPELLDGLTARGLSLTIVSNKPDWALQEMVKRFFGRWRFVRVAGQAPGGPLKPDPSVALEIAAAVSAEPSRCLFVGDSDVDMQTAVAAGMFGVGALWGYRDREELLQNGAKALVNHPLELLELVDGKGPS